jgi:hypothetical protein
MTLTLDVNSATIRESMKDLVWQAYLRDEIDFGQAMKSAEFGDTAKLTRFWQEHKQEKMAQAMAAQQAAAGMPAGMPAGNAAGTGTGAGAAHLLQPMQQQGVVEPPADVKQQGADRLIQADGGPGVAGTGGISA